MAESMLFFFGLWSNCINFLTECQIFGEPLIGILAAIFIVGVLLRALLVKA